MQVVWIGFVNPETMGSMVAHAGMAPDYPHYRTDFPISSEPSQPTSWSPAGRALRQGLLRSTTISTTISKTTPTLRMAADNPGLGHSLGGCFSAVARRPDGRLPVRLRGRA